jgi:hypothetical protein
LIVADQSETVGFLSRPDTYGGGVADVERIETHISVVFLAGERALKLKRAVRFPYLDFSTPALRHHFCQVEFETNRRTAPELYLGVVPVVRTASGGLGLGGPGEPVDWLVEMARFDQAMLFDRLATEGRLDRFVVESVADAIARFHAGAEPRRGAADRALIGGIIDGNRRAFVECGAGCVDLGAVERLTAAAGRALEAAGDLIDRRSGTGFVRHCHGDLHLRNIVIHGGRPVLFDAIEFSPTLAEIDVLYDLAFLVMDLDFRALRLLASILLNRYLDNSGDDGGLAAMPLFLSMRAAIRSHVDAAAAATLAPGEEAERLAAAARRYLELALDYLVVRPRRLIAIGGLSGSGKSRLARHLAPLVGGAPGARIVRTDCTRKRLAGVPLTARLASSQYGPEAARRTYAALLDDARKALAGGQSVIADGVFARPEERAAIEEVAVECGVPFHGLWLDARPQALEERVIRRRHNVSDATAGVVRMQLAYDLGEMRWPRLDTSGAKEATEALACERLGLDATAGR